MTMVGLILLISTIVGSVGQIIGGELADIIGRKKIMVFAMAARCMIFLALAYVINGAGDLVIIALMVSLSSFAGSLSEPATNALIAMWSQQRKGWRLTGCCGWATI
jgi:MFS family permease